MLCAVMSSIVSWLDFEKRGSTLFSFNKTTLIQHILLMRDLMVENYIVLLNKEVYIRGAVVQ